MFRFTFGGLAIASLLFVSMVPSTQAQGFFGIGKDEPLPSVSLPPANVTLEIPMPVNSANLSLLLAQAGEGGSLTALKQEKVERYRQHLQTMINRRLRQFFFDEEVPLADQRGQLSVQTHFRLTIVKQLSGMRRDGDFDVERGNMEVSGRFHYRVADTEGRPLREDSLDIDRLKLREPYQVRAQQNGEQLEDSTDQAILNLLSTLTDKVLSTIDDDIEADELQELLAS
ncbi:hypothetical protein Maes01_01247 [Microbulbifer aestuariivivens]|uniref:DUF3313 family protein n=1 Tax=Microbulbifer aestuariivivens TaxID=1908308 RepID=A0ABP9WNA3_9GAMM